MKIMALLPFMDIEDIKELALKIANGEVKGVKLAVVFPFVDEETLDEIVTLLIKEGKTKDLYTAIPFVSKKTLNHLYKEVKAGNIEGFKEEVLLPFLGKDAIKDLFNDLVKKAQNEPETDDEDSIDKVFDDEDE